MVSREWKFPIFLLGMFLVLGYSLYGDESSVNEKVEVKTTVKITIGSAVFFATMENNATVRSFIAQLPLSIKMQDLAREEKYGFAPKKLNVAGAQGRYDPSPGDICSYIPWANILIYYDNHGPENLEKLGTMDKSGIALLASYPGDVTLSFEVVK